MMGRRVFVAGALALVTGALALTAPVQASHSSAERLSKAYGGGNPNGESAGVEVSGNGRYVVFSSLAYNLESTADTNGTWDAFLYDRNTDTTTRVSESSSGAQGNGDSYADGVSNDGTVVFSSDATNLIGSDTNGAWDVFVHEPDGDTLRVSVSSTEGEGNADSDMASISADGDRVAFWSEATDLAANAGTGTIYLRNRNAGTTTARVGLTWDTHRGPVTISGNGEYIVFSTMESLDQADTDGFVFDVYLHDIGNDSTELLSVQEPNVTGDGFGWQPSISHTGRWVVFFGDQIADGDLNYAADIILLDRNDDSMDIVSVASDETQSDMWSQYPSVSDDGRYVAFHSQAENLDGTDLNGTNEDVYVRDRHNGTTHRINIQDSNQPLLYAVGGVVAPGGGFVVFTGDAPNGVSGDTNGVTDVFEFDL